MWIRALHTFGLERTLCWDHVTVCASGDSSKLTVCVNGTVSEREICVHVYTSAIFINPLKHEPYKIHIRRELLGVSLVFT